MSVTSSLPSYHHTEEWYATLLELQIHLAQRRSRKELERSNDTTQNSKKDEVHDAVIQSILRQLGIIIAKPDAQRRLDKWADTLLNGTDDRKEKIMIALEKCLPLLMDAPPKHAKNIIAAAAASVDSEDESEDESAISDAPSVPAQMPDVAAATRTVPRQDEDAWRSTLRQLQQMMQNLNSGGNSNVRSSTSVKDIVDTMYRLATLHPDPFLRNEITEQVRRIETANDRERENMFKELGKGFGLLLLTPFAVAGAGVFAAGTVVYATGKIVVGLGQILTLGRLQRK